MRNKDYSKTLAMTPKELHKKQWSKGWALSAIGWIVYKVLCLFKQKPKDFHGICPYFEIGKNWGGFSMGWFFVCGKNSNYHTKCHEVGHAVQNATVGGLRMLGYSICSFFRYWYRKIFETKTSYDDWFFEGDASRLGTQYVNNIKRRL